LGYGETYISKNLPDSSEKFIDSLVPIFQKFPLPTLGKKYSQVKNSSPFEVERHLMKFSANSLTALDYISH
jgi:hypothetical protein